jgi:hypothetical protein
MRLVIGTLACMGAGAIALADTPPPTPTQPAASGVTTAPAAAATPPTPSAAGASHEAAVDPREKNLRAKGYRLEMRRGEKMYCRNEEVMGSRLGGRKVCGTVEQLLDREHLSQEMAGNAQRQQLNPTGK